MAKIRKGDTVQVIAGRDAGVTGTVLVVYPDTQRVLVEGVNRVKRHTKVGQNARGAKTGGIVVKEAPIHVSNVMLVPADEKRATRVGFRRETVDRTRPDGTTYSAQRNVRVSKRSGKDI
ncbi:MAG: 50S ribosomal protein L24 [Candidatus Nanopelagicales bacterium]